MIILVACIHEPQRIVCNLSVNVIIHLKVKLNYEKILENSWISKEKGTPVISLIAKSKESDIVFMSKSVCDLPPFEISFRQKMHCLHRTSAMKTMRSASLRKRY